MKCHQSRLISGEWREAGKGKGGCCEKIQEEKEANTKSYTYHIKTNFKTLTKGYEFRPAQVNGGLQVKRRKRNGYVNTNSKEMR